MPYLVKSKSKPLRLRDLGAAGQPMIVVTADKWAPFQQLPKGCHPEFDKDLHIQIVDSIDGAEPAEIAAKPEKAPEPAKPKAEAPPRRGRGGRARLSDTVKDD